MGLYNLILFQLNIFRNKYKVKLKKNPSHTTYSENDLMILLYMDFTVLLS